MELVRFSDLKLSRLMIGTVQFGLKYGIANTTGQPAYEEVRSIIAYAFENGVNCLDTAAAYGTSEELIGRALGDLGLTSRVTVVTKVPRIPKDKISRAQVDQIVERIVVRSLELLRTDSLPICLFHDESDFQHMESLLRLKAKGLVKHVGISVGTPELVTPMIASGDVEAIQLPTNILDRRFRGLGVFEQANKQGVAIFVRSVFLQGVLVMPQDRLLTELSSLKPLLTSLRKLADSAQITMEELAVRYVLSIPGVTCGLTGVETLEQLQQNIEHFNKGPLDLELKLEVDRLIPELSEEILNPTNWSNRLPELPLKVGFE